MSDRETTSAGMETLGIGERLRNAREARGLSLATMEKLTKVRAAHLQALEDERFAALPERIYVRGFVRVYAAALGINPSELLDVYDHAFAASEGPILSGRAIEIPIRPAVPRSRLRRILGYVGAVVVLATIFLAYIGVQQVREFNRPVAQSPPQGAATPRPPAPARTQPASAPAPAPTVSAPALAGPATQPGSVPAPNPSAEIRLEVIASGTSWIRVIADGTRLFEGFVKDGEVHTWTARRQLTVRVGNIPVVALTVNGQPLTRPTTSPVWEGTFTVGQ